MKKALRYAFESALRFVPFKATIFSAVRPLHPPKILWGRLRFNGKFSVKVDGKRFYMFHNGDIYDNGIFWTGLEKGWAEQQALKLWAELCKEARTIFDVGANVGVYSLVAKTVNQNACVYGFEPVQATFKKYERNSKLSNCQIHTTHAALADFDGETEIYLAPGAFLTASLDAGDRRSVSERVQTIKLSTFIESQNVQKIELMKIDVEGFEAEVLKGMEAYLYSMKPTILIEILSDQMGEKIESIVGTCGYSYFNIDEDRGAIRQANLSVGNKTRHSRNFLLCQDAVVDQLRLNGSA